LFDNTRIIRIFRKGYNKKGAKRFFEKIIVGAFFVIDIGKRKD